MADGYTSLLVKSEGGEAEEIVSEEDGILISTMLRQYFMGLRTVGQWKNLADHWVSVASNSRTPLSPGFTGKPGQDVRNPFDQADRDDAGNSWTDFLQSRVGLSKTPINDDLESETEGEDNDDAMDFETLLLRKFWTRWALRAGVKASVCDPLREGEMTVDWTRTIAPVLEGRIKMVQN